MSKTNMRLIAAGVLAVAVCLLVPGFAARPGVPPVEVQVQSDYGVDPAQTDASRAIDMAERVAMGGQQATQDQLTQISGKLDAILDKLTATEKQMASLSKRMGAIEQRLGMVPPPPPVTVNPQPVVPAPQPQLAQPAKPVN
jgi:hypothetical protein